MNSNIEQVKKQLVAMEIVEDSLLQAIDSQADTVGAFAETLISKGVLTPFQADRVAEGHVNSLKLGRYVLLDRIGAGGMGQVFKARHEQMQRVVALKILPSRFAKDTDAIARFQREVQAAARLSHPNIVKAHDASEMDGVHYLVMEFVAGQDLASLVKSDGPVSAEKAIDYVIQSATGLKYAHQQGVMHRDIKPANLLLSEEGVVKILDMGLARFEQQGDASLTRTGMVMGTIDYMSPEQALDTRSADARADVYSLGCTLHYLLTGEAVFRADTMMKKLMAHREQEVPSLRDRAEGTSEAIDYVFQIMLAKQPEERLQSMGEVVDLLEQCRDGIVDAAALKTTFQAPGSLTSDSQSSLAPSSESQGARQMLSSSSWKARRIAVAITGGVVAAVFAIALAAVFWPHAEPSISKNAATQEPQEDGSNNGAAQTPPAVLAPPEPTITLPPVSVAPPISKVLLSLNPGEASDALAGVASAPIALPGVRRWQLQQVNPYISQRAVAWSPDAKLLAIGDDRGGVRIFRTSDGSMEAILPLRDLEIWSLDWNDDGYLAVSSSSEISIWQQAGDHSFQRNSLVDPHEGTKVHIDWAPDGKRLASHGHQDRTVKIWDQELNLLQTIKDTGTTSLIQLKWAPDAQCVAVSDHNRSLAIVPLNGTPQTIIQSKGPGNLTFAWHPTDDLVAMAEDASIALWNSSGERISSFPSPQPERRVLDLAWSPDGSQIAAAFDWAMFVMDTSGKVLHRFENVVNYARGIAWSPDGKRLASAGQCEKTSGLIVTLDGSQGPLELISPEARFAANLRAISWHPNGELLSIANESGGAVTHWNTKQGVIRKTKTWDHYLVDVSWSPNGERLACANANLVRIKLFDQSLNEVAETPLKGGQPREISWSPDSKRLTCSIGKQVMFLDSSGALQATWDLEEDSTLDASTIVLRSVWNSGGDQLAIALGSSGVQIRDRDGKLLNQWEGGYRNEDLAWASQDAAIYGSARENAFSLYNLDGLVLGQFHNRNCSRPEGISLNPRDARIATRFRSSFGRPACGIWSPTGELLQLIRTGPFGGTKATKWNQQGDRLAILSRNGNVQVWGGTPLKPEATLLVGAEDSTFVIDGTGTKLLHGDEKEFDGQFRYVVDMGDGLQRTMNYAEFQDLLPPELEPQSTSITETLNERPLAGIIPQPVSTDADTKWQLCDRELTQRLPNTQVAWSSLDQIAVPDGGGSVKIYDRSTMEVQRTLPTGESSIYSAAWSPDGETLVFGTTSGAVFYYHIDGAFRRLPRQHTALISTVRWRPDGSQFATAGVDGDASLTIWDSDGTVIRNVRHQRGIGFAGWHPSNGSIASYSNGDGKLIVWDKDGKQRATSTQTNIVALDWVPNANQLYLWPNSVLDVSTQEVRPSPWLKLLENPTRRTNGGTGGGFSGVVVNAKLSPNGHMVALGKHNNSLQILSDDNQELPSYQGTWPGEWVVAVDWSKDSQEVLFAASRETLRVVGLDGNVLSEAKLKWQESGVSWSSDGQYVATCGSDNQIRRWSANGSSVTFLDGHQQDVRSVAYSPVDGRLASLANDGKLFLWDEQGQKAAEFDGVLVRQTGATHDLAWHPSGKMIAAAGAASTLMIVELESGEVHHLPMFGPVLSLAWNPEGTELAIGSEPKSVSFWTPSQTEARFFSVATVPKTIEWTDAKEILVAGETAWRVPVDGSEPTEFIKTASAERVVRFSPDQQWIAAAAEDVALFHSGGIAVATFSNRDSIALSVVWSPDGKKLAATYNDGALRVWDLSTGKVDWIGLPTETEKAVTLSPSGKILFGDPAALDATHQVIQHIGNAQLRTVKPSEFLKNANVAIGP